MPKIADVKSKARSTRKPLRDVSNGGFKSSVRNPVIQKSTADTQQQDPVTICGDGASRDPLDRLLLVHSDLSVLIHQIDELVVQALEQKVRNKKEIESFAHLLNKMQTSLKPWIPRFQKFLSTNDTTVSKNQLETILATSKKITPPSSSINKPLENQESYKLDFMVSPSPLVSWHAECTQEGGRSLFMLTPLPKPSAFTSKLKKSSKSVFKNITNDLPVATSEFSSPEKVLKRNNTTNNDNNSIIVSTPYLKMSPPKSCILLEPASEHYNKKTNGGVKNAAINGGGDSEPSSSSSQGYGHLGLKYPELFGIKHGDKMGNSRKAVEASPNWCISPPKTCVLLEPSDDDKVVIKDVDINFHKPRDKGVIDSTPMCKDLDTTVLRGKRVGENTLKKELWMRFEAATGHELRFKASVGGHGQTTTNTSNECSNGKGFMELLEEVCSDD
ncbi:unnamed protein product [Lactuca virosa]|uniref:Uncharacterized protein n=1 Tax=Lactuca virosa TaxID=75947 RepID=A0AAU9M4A3_9ASTR|nr:unnamed protein product [Lactuca virosa]